MSSLNTKPASSKCPICDAQINERYTPFCSKRCADVDLHRWLNGSYAIPAVEADDDICGDAQLGDEPPE